MTKTVIFDLDGTLMNTIEDLMDAVNFALKKFGYKERSLEEILSFVGNGVEKLVRRSVPENCGEEAFSEVLACFKEYYSEHSIVKTRPYDGICEAIENIRKKGIKTAVVTNKFQSAAQDICDRFFGGLLDVVVGSSPERANKPDPAPVKYAMELLEASPETTVYVGDSEVDIQTARNSKLPFICVSWGFRKKEFLKSMGASVIADSPRELCEIIFGNNS